jgi:hypothetical protein
MSNDLTTPRLLTGAGEVPFIVRAREILEQKGNSTKCRSAREIADQAEDAANEITKRYLVDRFRSLNGGMRSPSPGLGPDDGPLPVPNFELMLGIVCGNEICIYTLTPDGVAGREEGYASAGSGSAFAEYFLARLYRDDLTLEEAIRVAIYVVEEVKKVDLHCGGPTQVVALTKKGVQRKSASEIREVVQLIDEYDNSLKEAFRVISKGPDALLQRDLDSAARKRTPLKTTEKQPVRST